MRRNLIALHGLPGSGKDTMAKIFIDSGRWEKVSFAAPIKEGISAMFGIPMEDIENPLLKNSPDYKFGRSIRYMAQTLGTEWGRNLIDADIWLKLAHEKINEIHSRGKSAIITDLRFVNEAEMIDGMDGEIIHILRGDNKFSDTASKTGVGNHISDASIPDKYISKIIKNNGTIEEFNMFARILAMSDLCSNIEFKQMRI